MTTQSLSLLIRGVIVSFSYFDSPTSDKLAHSSSFDWLNFIGLALILYILHFLLYDEAALLILPIKQSV